MSDNFKKVIEFAGFLLESGKKTKEELAEQMNQKAMLEDKQCRMQEQAVYMGEKWQREQKIVEELENELRIKDETETDMKQQIDSQSEMITQLNQQIDQSKAKLANKNSASKIGMTPKASELKLTFT